MWYTALMRETITDAIRRQSAQAHKAFDGTELDQLIAEQARDGDREYGEAGVISLDALHEEYLGDEWADPTFELVSQLWDAEEGHYLE
jgi:hypothetical protein